MDRFGSQVLDYFSGQTHLLDPAPAYWQRHLERSFLRLLSPELMPILLSEMERAVGEWNKLRSKLELQEESIDDSLIALIQAHLASVWRNVAQEISSAITESITRGLQSGQELREMMDTIGELVKSSEYRLERIVRTETTRAYNYAMIHETALEDEIAGYRYSVVLDDRTSAVCRPIANRFVRKEQLEFAPPLHPNCRTVLVPVLTDQLPESAEVYARPSDFDATARRFGVLPGLLRNRLRGVRDDTTAQFWNEFESKRTAFYRYCLRITRSEELASDLMSNTMLRAYERYAFYDRDRADLITWLKTIARNLYLNERQVRARNCELNEDLSLGRD